MGRRPSRSARDGRSGRAAAATAGVADIAGSRLRTAGVLAICAKVALVPLVFDPAGDMPFVAPKALLSQCLALFLVATMAALVGRHGRSVAVWSPLHVPVLAYFGVSVVATVFAADPYVGLYGTHARRLGLIATADLVVLYFALVFLVRTRSDVRAIGACAVAAAFAVVGYEAVQLLGRDPFDWAVDGSVRPFSALGQPTVLAQYLTTIALGVVAAGLLARGMPWSWRAGALTAAAILLLGAAATGTRSAVLGLALGGAVMVLFAWLAYPTPRTRLGIGAMALAMTVGAAAVLLVTPIGARLAATLDSLPDGADEAPLERLEPSAAGRLALYGMGASMITARPFLGYGPDNFVVAMPEHRPEGAPALMRQTIATSAHSWFIQIGATVGLVGLACFIAIAGVALLIALRPVQQTTAATGAVMLAAYLGTGLTTVNELGTEWLFWTAAGMVAVAGVSVPAASSPRLTSRRRDQETIVRRSLPAVSLLAAALVAVSAWPAFDASRTTRASRDARLIGDGRTAVTLGARATHSDPGRASYWDTLGLAHVATRELREAAAAFERATRLAPYDVRYNADYIQAQLLLQRSGDAGAKGRAIAAADRGVGVDPNSPGPHLTRAVVMQVAGDLIEARRSVERALALDPDSTNTTLYVTAAQVLLESGRSQEAVSMARHGLSILGLSNRSVPLRVELARALAVSGQPQDALAELDTALALIPGEPTVVRLRADIQAALAR